MATMDGRVRSPLAIFADFRFRKLSKNFGKKVGRISREDVWIFRFLPAPHHFVTNIYIVPGNWRGKKRLEITAEH